MIIKQISIFVENKSGRLAEITKLLGQQKINILALSIADTTDYGILRLIVTEPEKAEAVLKECGLTIRITEVIGIVVSHTPGGLSLALNALHDQGIDIEYMYAFVGSSRQEAMVIIRVEDNAKAIEVLKKNNVEIMSNDFSNMI